MSFSLRKKTSEKKESFRGKVSNFFMMSKTFVFKHTQKSKNLDENVHGKASEKKQSKLKGNLISNLRK